uniref:RNase H type-1 domain-containing protein n=1 Tax=Brassica campestris TaxID=3711 RepID=M4F2T4_BRACM
MRRRDDHSRSNRYGGSRVGTGPYDRKPAQTWKQKSLGDQRGYRVEPAIASQDIVPYEHSERTGSDGKQVSQEMRPPEATVTRRLASTIVTPSRVDIPMEGNVTKRVKEATRALSFPALSDQELQDGIGDKQIIGALSDMEIADPHDGEMMECDVHDDDLLAVPRTLHILWKRLRKALDHIKCRHFLVRKECNRVASAIATSALQSQWHQSYISANGPRWLNACIRREASHAA